MSAYETTATTTPAHLTLFFKHDKSTTVLSLLPSDSLLHAKQLLLTTLASRSITTFPGSSISLPRNPSDIEFGILNDKRDSSSGWSRAEDRASLPKKKDKRGKTEDGEVESVGEWDLKDGGYVAYRLKKVLDVDINDEDVEDVSEEEWNVVVPAYDDEEGDEDEEETEVPRPRNHVAR